MSDDVPRIRTYSLGVAFRSERVELVEHLSDELYRWSRGNAQRFQEDLAVDAGLMAPLPRHLREREECAQRSRWEQEYRP